MAAPTRYSPSYDFTAFQVANPNTPLPADKVEIELVNLETTTDEIINNLDLIQRSDGQLHNGIVTYDSLSAETKALLGTSMVPRGEWTTATAYSQLDLVSVSDKSYIAVVDHTSAALFATDLADDKWLIWSSDIGLVTYPGLADIAGLTATDGNVIVGDGTHWVSESGATARTSLGVGTGDSPQFTAINLGHASDTTISRVSAGVIAVEGSNVLLASGLGSITQAYDSELAAIAGLTSAADRVPYFTGSGTAALATLTSAGRDLIDDADVAAMLTTLGLSGTVRQVVATTKTDTYTNASSGYNDITGLSATITPSSASSRILVLAVVNGSVNTASDNGGQVQLVRGSTAIAIGDASGSRTRAGAYLGVLNTNTMAGAVIIHVDSPATTSATTYKLQGRPSNSGDFHCNRSNADSDSDVQTRTASFIVLVELAT